jgi:formylglycine-generating enzyme required for sulfatase activity
MQPDRENSLSDEATFAGRPRPQRSDVSLGDEQTLGDGLSGQDTIIDDIEVVDLDARYRIEGELGQGGMGAVLLATDMRLDRKVAIKRILGEAAGNRMAVQRFLTEAKSIAALNHPNVVQIYDYGRATDGPFLIMEFVDGGSLLDRCRDGAMPLEAAVDMACQLCDGLAKAHDLGIIHRDIKPANVLLTKDGIPKLTDFGLAKAQTGDHGQTVTGAVLGTPDFMPPEQRRDAALVDHRSDLWSLAATIYQMLTGRSPKVIRLHELPQALQGVLAKALEDEKEARYQSVRELRDAIKASLRAVGAAPAAVAAEAGQCPACGVHNDISRKFCRNCGGSLEVPCLSCDRLMPVGEEICGSCGSKQTLLLESRRAEMAATQAKAEGLLGDFAFDKAAEFATRLRDEPHARLSHLKPWAEAFLGEVESSRSQQITRATESLAEAVKHEQAFDYLSAVFALESIPDAMRSVVLPGAREPVTAVLERLKQKQAASRTLEALIKQRLSAKAFDGLLPEVDKLLALQPDRRDIHTLRQQLVQRQQKKETARDEAIATARSLMANHDYDGSLAALAKVPMAAMPPEVGRLRSEAEQLAAEARNLSQEIRAAVAGKHFDGLLQQVEAYLSLKPADEEIGRLRQSLVERDERIGAEIASRLEQARNLAQSCRFEDAHTLLSGIPEARRSEDVAECLDRSTRLAPLRQATMRSLAKAVHETYASAIESSRMYEQELVDAGITDGEFAALLSTVEAAQAQAERTRRILKRAGIAAAAVAAVVVLTAAGLWIRSSARAAALATALQKGNWSDALALDPENVTALVGRARGKLGSAPPDIEGAFSDLDQANRTRREVATVKAAKGDAHAARAREHARGGKLDAAAKDLSEAQLGPASAEWIAKSKTAITTAWVSRAEEACKKGDVKQLRQAVSSAKAAGAIDPSLLAVWEEYAHAQIQSLDAKGLELACAEGRKLGLPQTQEAAWWLEFGELGVEKEDEGAVRTGAAGWQALGLQPDADKSAAGLWKLQAAACLKRFDAKGLASACSEGDKNGLPSTDIAELWIHFAELAAAPPREDPAAIQTAVKAAKAAGAIDEVIKPLQAHGLMLEAIASIAKGDTKSAVAIALEASLLDPATAVAALEQPANAAIREAVVVEYRTTFDAAIADNNWDTTFKIAGAAGKLDGAVSGWFGEAIARHPGGLSAVPPEVLIRLPAATIAALPPSTLAALPPATLAALPPAALAALPPAGIAALPPIRNSIGIELKVISAGTFTRGKAGVQSNKTQQQVTLTKSFYIGVHEVTNAQWKRVMGNVPSNWKNNDRPVEHVSWHDAVEFCKKLSLMPDERNAGRVYRLPIEAEWEHACRAGTATKYSFGDDESQLGDYAWYRSNSGEQTHPVGQKKPNAWGLFDMRGNVNEWCSDWFHNYGSGAVTAPQGPSKAFVRGDCWHSSAECYRSAGRYADDPSVRRGDLGFRLAMSSSVTELAKPASDSALAEAPALTARANSTQSLAFGDSLEYREGDWEGSCIRRPGSNDFDCHKRHRHSNESATFTGTIVYQQGKVVKWLERNYLCDGTRRGDDRDMPATLLPDRTTISFGPDWFVRVTQPSPANNTPVGTLACPRLGKRAVFKAGDWSGEWVRRGDTNVYECRHTHAIAGEVFTTLASLSADGLAVKGAYTQGVSSAKGSCPDSNWTATLSADGTVLTLKDGATVTAMNPNDGR